MAGRAASLRKALALPAASAGRQRVPRAPPLPRPPPGPRRLPPALGGGLWRAPARPPLGGAWCCRLCKARRRVRVRTQKRATGGRRTWGPAGAHGSTGGRRPRVPRVRVRGRVRPRCAGAKPRLPCVCAGPRDVRARGKRPPRSTAHTCWRLSVLRRIPCRIPRRGGRCLGGGRAATRGRDGGARGRRTAGKGGPRALAGGRGRGAGSPCRASSAGPPATCRRGESCGHGRRR